MEIDDNVPFEYDQPIFSRSKTGHIWGILLEKAYAKLFGSYLFLKSGDSSEALSVLTGAPCIEFK